MTVIPCEVVQAREVAAGDVLWIAVDGFQKGRGRIAANERSVSFLLANDIVAHRLSGDQALIQARGRR